MRELVGYLMFRMAFILNVIEVILPNKYIKYESFIFTETRAMYNV